MMESAYLVVTKFEVLYRRYAIDPRHADPVYAFPVYGTSSERLKVKYHGLDRDPLSSFWDAPALAAELRMHEFEECGRCDDALIFDESAMLDVLSWAQEELPGIYEPVWARSLGSKAEPPAGCRSIGFEPTEGYFSTLCDCMCFSRWHGTDPGGVVLREHFAKLNRFGLFESPEAAAHFLAHYQSFEWTECGEFEIAEVFLPPRVHAQSGGKAQPPAT